MSIKNRINCGFVFFALLSSIILFSPHLASESENSHFNFTSTKGMNMQIIKDDSLPLCHGELVIYTPQASTEPSLAYFVLESMFNEAVQTPPHSGLLANLRKLGNDLEISDSGDYIKIKINFLDRKLSTYIHLIKDLFTFKNFTQEKLQRIIDQYPRSFFKNPEWKKTIAFSLACSHLFPDHPLGKIPLDRENIKKISLKKIIAYYRENFHVANASLLLKGKINPYIAFGLIEKAFKNLKRKIPPHKIPELKVKPGRSFFLLDTGTSEPPKIFWFKAIPPVKNQDHMSFLVINKILFGIPMGKIFQNAVLFGIKNLRIESEIRDHAQVSVICNTISLFKTREIEKLLVFIENETRKLKFMNIDRKEYLYALNYFFGRFKVDTGFYENQIRLKSLMLLSNAEPDNSKLSQENFKGIFQQVSLNSLNRIVRNQSAKSSNNRFPFGEVIVIAGNAKKIARELSLIKPVIFKPFRF